ncbi:MAG: DNA repair protein RadC [Bacteroidaceae bacterium]|nr:DNA repair protein RadC [Bacteroidaceae bacterium]
MSEALQKKSIKEWAVDDRPREKAMKNGISTLSKSELLAILVGSGNDEESAVDLMKRVLDSCGNSISELARLSVDDLCTFRGIGPAKAISIMAACELWKRRENGEGEQVCIASSRDLYKFFHPILCDSPVERCYVMLLNRMNRVVDHVLIGTGGLTATVVDIRLVMREALMKRATAIALCHNHPSGNVRPSREDDKLTENLGQACKVMNIRMLDHIVLADGAYYSYNDEGRL